MKERLHYAIEAALFIAVIILFVFHFTGDKKPTETFVQITNDDKEAEFLQIAFINADSLLYNYKFAIDLNEQLTKFVESSERKYQDQEKKFMAEVEDYQYKAKTGNFTSLERQQNAERALEQKQGELQQMGKKLGQDFNERQYKMNETIHRTITVQLKEYNKSKGYHFIFTKSADNILYAHEYYNITAEVIEFLNRHYAANPSMKPVD